jgi:hypothetical protein
VLCLLFVDLQMEMYKVAPYLKFLPLPKKLEGNRYWDEGLEQEKEMDLERAR